MTYSWITLALSLFASIGNESALAQQRAGNSNDVQISDSDLDLANGKSFTVTIEGEDAKALFSRLQKKEFVGDGNDRTTTKIGQNVICTRGKTNWNPILPKFENKCSLSFLIETGELHETYPIGEDDPDAGLANEDGYQGKSVQIAEGSEDAIFTIHGKRAWELFDGMTEIETKPARILEGKLSPVAESEVEIGSRKGNQQGTTVLVKKSIHVTCFRSVFTLAPVTECVLTLETKSGRARLSSEGGMNETSPKAVAPAGPAPAGPAPAGPAPAGPAPAGPAPAGPAPAGPAPAGPAPAGPPSGVNEGGSGNDSIVIPRD